MVTRLHRHLPDNAAERPRPTFPSERQTTGLFLGWGPKI